MRSPVLTRSSLLALAGLWFQLDASKATAPHGLVPVRRSGFKYPQWHQAVLEKRAANTTAPLRNVQVTHPPVVPKGGRTCKVVLVEHAFANSYYAPAIVDYVPPTGCGTPGDWAAVVLNITATANGTQFDRLASISLSNVEIWRTSTAEPTKAGIIWTALKDVTSYNALLAKAGRLMFDENNVNDATYTGIFITTLTATFYEATRAFPTPKSADLILPLSTLSTAQSQMFTYPGDSSNNVSIPQNTAEAWVEVYASGNGNEEFWYTNLPDEYVDEFDADAGLIAKGPFREVQLLIDGELAGIVIPFPVIYAGGANPLLWRPVASLRAYDIPSFIIDATPFLPTLTDSLPHNFTLIVLGQGSGDHSVNANWYLTGNIQITLDSTSKRTTGRRISYVAAPYATTTTSGGPSSDNLTVVTDVTARRTLEISTLINTGSSSKIVSFSQVVSYTNEQVYSRDGLNEAVTQKTNVAITATHGASVKPITTNYEDYPTAYSASTYSFPLLITTNYEDYPTAYSASVGPYEYNRVLTTPISGRVETTKSSQNGTATLSENAAGTAYIGNSATSETYDFVDSRGNTYREVIKAANSTITVDAKSGSLSGDAPIFPIIPMVPHVYPGRVTQGFAQLEGICLRPVAGKLAQTTAAHGGLVL